MNSLTFKVMFHEPFLVRSGAAGAGLDATSRADAVLPASSIKGAMRAACQHVLEVDDGLVAAVFGREGSTGGRVGQGAWAWTDAHADRGLDFSVRARNRVDAATGVVVPEALTFSQEVWQGTQTELTFDVEQVGALSAEDTERHTVVLQVAAHAVTALGSWRNRGQGTVTIRAVEPLTDLAGRWDALVPRAQVTS